MHFAKASLVRSLSTLAAAVLAISGCEHTVGMKADLSAENGTRADELSDRDIAEAIEAEIYVDPAVSPDDVNVVVTHGIVQLTGEVPTLIARHRAERLAMITKGVRAVSNQLTLSAPVQPDEDVEAQVEMALLLDAATDEYELDVSVLDGIVTLQGTTQSWVERDLAERVAKGVKGVRAVRNRIQIEYVKDRTDYEIGEEIQERLVWDALVDDALVQVGVEDGTVELTGTVGSAVERERATLDAWVPGVKSVTNDDLSVEWWARNKMKRKKAELQRDDDNIRSALLAALVYDPRVKSFNVDAYVDDGVVTLEGTVDNLKALHAAERVAWNTTGVVGVNNDMNIKLAPPVADSKIRERIEQSLLINPVTESYEVAVSVDNGLVTLTGRVDSMFERLEAENVASGIEGVVDVDNQINVVNEDAAVLLDGYVYPRDPYVEDRALFVPKSTTRADEPIEREIEDQLFWSPFVDSYQVKVTVTDGHATLTGTVDTWRERRLAELNAYEGGATAVTNLLEVHGN